MVTVEWDDHLLHVRSGCGLSVTVPLRALVQVQMRRRSPRGPMALFLGVDWESALTGTDGHRDSDGFGEIALALAEEVAEDLLHRLWALVEFGGPLLQEPIPEDDPSPDRPGGPAAAGARHAATGPDPPDRDEPAAGDGPVADARAEVVELVLRTAPVDDDPDWIVLRDPAEGRLAVRVEIPPAR